MLVNTFDFNTCKLKMNWCSSPTLVGQVGRTDVRLVRPKKLEYRRTSRTPVRLVHFVRLPFLKPDKTDTCPA